MAKTCEKPEMDFVSEALNSLNDGYKRYVVAHENKTFSEFIKEFMRREKCDSAEKFCVITRLNENIFSCLKRKEYRPTKRVIVAICVGLKLDYAEALELLKLAGYALVLYDKVDYAYHYILQKCNELDIDLCNELLEACGIDRKYQLGSIERE